MAAETSPRRADKRTLITDAAIEVFAEKGFNQARVADVARKAGVADGTIYLYFKNKEDLLLSIFEQKMDELLAGLGEALAKTDDPVERVRAFARFHFRQVRDNRRAAEVLQVELRLSNKFLKEYRPEKLWAYLGVFGQIVREGQARGIFRADVDPFIGMWAFFGALDELAMQWVLSRKAGIATGRSSGASEKPDTRERFSLESAADQVADIFIRGLLTQSELNIPAPGRTRGGFVKVGVCVKVTADTDARLKASADGATFEVTGKKVVGPYDAFAVEAGIQAKEKHAGTTVVSFTVGGGEEVLSQLRGGPLALGADKAVVIYDPALAGTDALGVARALAAAIRAEGCDLVFCGKQAIDDDNVQVPAMIAELLGYAQVSRVVEFSVDGASFTATRAMDGGVREVVAGSLPAVITAERGLNTPRYAKLPAIMAAKKKPVDTLNLAALALAPADVAARAVTTAYAQPPDRPKGRKLTGDVDTVVQELVRLLREEAKVL